MSLLGRVNSEKTILHLIHITKRLFLQSSIVTLAVIGICLFPHATHAVSANPANVFRFYSPVFNNAHFYTTDSDEASRIITTDTNWKYEGINFGAYTNDIMGCQSRKSVFRFWSGKFKSHFFTMSEAEKNSLMSGDPNWAYEGVAYCADSTQVASSHPLYRFWSSNYKKHFFTADLAEKNSIVATNPNWNYESTAYYVPKGKDCLHPDATIYDKTYTDRTNSEFLLANGYSTAPKFHNALSFAGLLSTVDSPQTVVFAPNDYVFDNNLNPAQLAFMNQSPANMQSVLGWHIITGCVIYNHYIENVNASITLTTLNGPVTYSPEGIGEIDGAEIAIWDWFTSNGAVHLIADFIRPPDL